MAQFCRLGPKVGCRLALFCIHRVNRVNSRNDSESWWQHHKHCPGIIIIIIIIILSGNTLKYFISNRHFLTPPSDPLPQCLRFNFWHWHFINSFTYLLTYLYISVFINAMLKFEVKRYGFRTCWFWAQRKRIKLPVCQKSSEVVIKIWIGTVYRCGIPFCSYFSPARLLRT